MKSSQSMNLYEAFAWQYRAWWGVGVPTSVALVDMSMCVALGTFPYTVGMPVAWKFIAIPFLIGAVVRGCHAWQRRAQP